MTTAEGVGVSMAI